MEKLKIPYPIIVEGKYDKNTLQSVLDARIITTNGFSVFNAAQKRAMLLEMAKQGKIIILTDSDGAGIQIRSTLQRLLPKESIINLYTPQIKGKERRKKTASRAGFLGVEGMSAETIRELFLPLSKEDAKKPSREISKLDFYNDGLSGGSGAAEKRKALAERFKLPSDISSNALIDALNILTDYDGYAAAVAELGDKEK